ncbi:hypothetical protein [Heyndrickxia acidicola]|uniref:Uncharacterized protein n=1 Tax=Heyndrickxia acidicola TaxID=209389 RepID=A0ABU6MCB7_9BACI|nr:hypothetical protein [Heyndrickxia acidicola]MED1202313.1 hypothetical protein [Heyndrickxia acidicola]
MNLVQIIKMLDDLKIDPYVNSHVTHTLRNNHKEVAFSYSKESEVFHLHDICKNRTTEYSYLEDIANVLYNFIKD